MIMLKSGNFKFRTPSSKQHGRFDLPEAGETMKKKPKLTGHSLKSSFKRKRQEETVPGKYSSTLACLFLHLSGHFIYERFQLLILNFVCCITR